LRKVDSELAFWQLALASLGWAILTLLLLILLGVCLPVLLAATLLGSFPGAAVLTASLVGLALTVAAVIMLGRETQRRVYHRADLYNALMRGYGLALMLGVPALLLWFGYWILVG
jgi:hypothetical protein